MPLNKKVSVIIPAYNESNFIRETIESYKSQDYNPLEVIVVDNSDDEGETLALCGEADKVLSFKKPIGVCAARNKGAEVAEGEILIFSDADSFLEQGGIAKIAQNMEDKTVGTPLGKGKEPGVKEKLFFLIKNNFAVLNIRKGVVDGVLVCSKKLFMEIGGFDPGEEVLEFNDFIKRAQKAGAKYKVFKDCYAMTSMRRYEEKGYLKTFLFFLKLKALSFFGKDKMAKKGYYKLKGKK